METLAITDKTDPAIFKLGTKKIANMIERPYSDRAAYYDEHKNDPGFNTYQQERELIKVFADKYGLDYSFTERWK